MCGIAGIVDKTGRIGGDRIGSLVERMTRVMTHRGPDDSGHWVSRDKCVALGQRRLAIIDTSEAGRQPMPSPDGRKQIVFNGEIYNFLELRERFERLGERFVTRSDTEVLIRVLERRGVDGLLDLDAMFAFGWFEEDTGRLTLARDMFGEKPLYYVDTPAYFAFASELTCLVDLPDFDATIDADAIAQYLAFQYVPAPASIYRSVRKLEPGSFLVRSGNGTVDVRRYYMFEAVGQERATRSLADAADELEAVLIQAVQRRLISDVPLGAFLSGGVDSSTVVALATKIGKAPVRTYTIGFEGFSDSEHFDAAAMAKHIGADHHEQILKPDGVDLAERIGRILDEPNGDSSCLPTFLLSAFTREHVTVALSGDGGDELFGGYGRYLASVDEQQRKAREGGMEWWTPGAVYWASRILVFPETELALLTGNVPESLATDLNALRSQMDDPSRPLIHRMREADASHYMPGAVLAKVDRMSMQSSLEVRAPLIGRDVAAFAQSLSAEECVGGGQGKLVLKEVAKRYLPADWLTRPKRGFGLPMGLWGAATLMPAAERLLLAPDARILGWIDRDHIVGYLDRMRKDFSAYRVWSLLILEVWLRSHPHKVGLKFGDVAPAEISPEPQPGLWGRMQNAMKRVVSRQHSF